MLFPFGTEEFVSIISEVFYSLSISISSDFGLKLLLTGAIPIYI
jgi:hypothetical protein